MRHTRDNEKPARTGSRAYALLQKVVPERHHWKISRWLAWTRNPSTIWPQVQRQRWINNVLFRHDTECRNSFFMAAASFLWTNRADNLRDGYYMEFGCFGAVTMRLAWQSTRHIFNLQYLGFDSFEGLPEIAEIDRQPIWEKGRLAMGEEEFAAKSGVPAARLRTIKGFFDASLTPEIQADLLPRKASIIYVDCDLYTSTVPVLDFIPPFLQTGTIIAFDDWNCFWADPERGQRRAWREFLAAHPTLRFEPFFSTHALQSFIFIG